MNVTAREEAEYLVEHNTIRLSRPNLEVAGAANLTMAIRAIHTVGALITRNDIITATGLGVWLDEIGGGNYIGQNKISGTGDHALAQVDAARLRLAGANADVGLGQTNNVYVATI